MANKPIFKTKDMKQEMRKADNGSIVVYPTYRFSRKSELYQDKIGGTPKFYKRQ